MYLCVCTCVCVYVCLCIQVCMCVYKIGVQLGVLLYDSPANSIETQSLLKPGAHWLSGAVPCEPSCLHLPHYWGYKHLNFYAASIPTYLSHLSSKDD